MNDWDIFRVEVDDEPTKRAITFKFYRNAKTTFCQWEVPQDLMLLQAAGGDPDGHIQVRVPSVSSLKPSPSPSASVSLSLSFSLDLDLLIS